MNRRLSEEMLRLGEECKGREMTLQEFLTLVPARAQFLMIFIFCLPFLLFIPLPGLSIVFGFFILLNGFRVALKKRIWLPGFLLRHKVSGPHLDKTFLISCKILKKIERWLKPRGAFLYAHPWTQTLNAWILASCGLLLALPLPPGTNFLPALSCSLICLGSLEGDGLFIVFGYLSFILTVLLYVVIPVYLILP